MRLCDRIPDPEDIPDPRTRRRGIDNFASFMRFLAPVARAGGDVAVLSEGERVFNAVGCAACHVPALTTGPSANPLFNRRSVRAVLGPAAARRRHRRRHPAGVGRGQRDPHAGAVGSALPPAAAARRLRGDDRRRDPASRRRGAAGARGLRPDDRGRARRPAGVPEQPVVARPNPSDRRSQCQLTTTVSGVSNPTRSPAPVDGRETRNRLPSADTAYAGRTASHGRQRSSRDWNSSSGCPELQTWPRSAATPHRQ